MALAKDAGWKARHHRVQVWVSLDEIDRYTSLQRRYGGVGWTELFRLGMQALERQRPSEAMDKVRVVVPDWVARYSERALVTMADSLMALAKRQSQTPDGQARALEYRREAGGYYDAAAWQSEVVRQYDVLSAQHPERSCPGDPSTRWRSERRTDAKPSPHTDA